MAQPTSKQLETLLQSVSDALQAAKACGSADTVTFLTMAELDLTLKIHGISDDELTTFCRLLEQRGHPTQSADIIDARSYISKLRIAKAR